MLFACCSHRLLRRQFLLTIVPCQSAGSPYCASTNFANLPSQSFQPPSSPSRLSADANFSCVNTSCVPLLLARTSTVTCVSFPSSSPNSVPPPSFSQSHV